MQRKKYLSILPGVLLVAAAASAIAWAADAPAPPAVSTFAPAEDLIQQVNFYIKRIDEALANQAEYDEVKQSRTRKDANTLAAIGLMLGMHDKDHALKSSAAALVKSSQALAAAFEDYDQAAKAFADVKAAAAGSSTAQPAGELKWERVASLGALMKQVPLVNTGLKRGVSDERRFKRQLAESAGQSAALAAIAQAAMFDTHEVKEPATVEQWYQYCAEMRDAAAEVNAAIHAEDQPKAKEAFVRLSKSCDTCHEVFRKEEH